MTKATYVGVAGSKFDFTYKIVYADGAFALIAYKPSKPQEKLLFAMPDEVFRMMQKCYRKERQSQKKAKCQDAPRPTSTAPDVQ